MLHGQSCIEHVQRNSYYVIYNYRVYYINHVLQLWELVEIYLLQIDIFKSVLNVK